MGNGEVRGLDEGIGRKRAATAAAFAALTLMTLRNGLMNIELFPLFDDIFPLARDLSVAAGAAVNVLVALIAFYRPSILRARVFNGISAVLCVGGAGLALAGVHATSEPTWLAVAGTVVSGIGTALIWLTVCCGLIAFNPRAIFIGIPCASAAASLAAWDVGTLPRTAGLLVMFVCPLVALALTYRRSRDVLREIGAASAPRDTAVTRPASFLPFTSALFGALFVYSIAGGFGVRFGSTEGNPESLLLQVAVLAVLAIWNLRSADMRRFDRLFEVSVLLVVAGFLVAPLGSYQQLASSLTTLSSACFGALATVVLVSAAARNPLSSLVVFGWGSALQSLGTIVGANLGALASGIGTDAVFLGSAAAAVVLLAYTFYLVRAASFADTVAGIEPVAPLRVPGQTPDERFDAACAAIAARAGLTPRETDVFRLLARGRNNLYIQEELVLARNTVKSHIKHVYQKLDVHSQQELIDLMERAR